MDSHKRIKLFGQNLVQMLSKCIPEFKIVSWDIYVSHLQIETQLVVTVLQNQKFTKKEKKKEDGIERKKSENYHQSLFNSKSFKSLRA